MEQLKTIQLVRNEVGFFAEQYTKPPVRIYPKKVSLFGTVLGFESGYLKQNTHFTIFRGFLKLTPGGERILMEKDVVSVSIIFEDVNGVRVHESMPIEMFSTILLDPQGKLFNYFFAKDKWNFANNIGKK